MPIQILNSFLKPKKYRTPVVYASTTSSPPIFDTGTDFNCSLVLEETAVPTPLLLNLPKNEHIT
jgi:hypothetical protein